MVSCRNQPNQPLFLKQRSLGEGEAWLFIEPCGRQYAYGRQPSLKWLPQQSKQKAGTCISKERRPSCRGLTPTGALAIPSSLPSPDSLNPPELFLAWQGFDKALLSPLRALSGRGEEFGISVPCHLSEGPQHPPTNVTPLSLNSVLPENSCALGQCPYNPDTKNKKGSKTCAPKSFPQSISLSSPHPQSLVQN